MDPVCRIQLDPAKPDPDPAPVQKTWLWIRLGSIMKAVPSHIFQLDLEPCHFTHGWGGDNRLLREQIDSSWDFLRELIHHTSPQALQQIVISRRQIGNPFCQCQPQV